MTETPDTEEALPLPEELEGFLRRLEEHTSKTRRDTEAARSFIPGAERLAERLPEAIREEMGLRARLLQAITTAGNMETLNNAGEVLSAIASVLESELSEIARAARHRVISGEKSLRILEEIREDAMSSFERLVEEEEARALERRERLSPSDLEGLDVAEEESIE